MKRVVTLVLVQLLFASPALACINGNQAAQDEYVATFFGGLAGIGLTTLLGAFGAFRWLPFSLVPRIAASSGILGSGAVVALMFVYTLATTF